MQPLRVALFTECYRPIQNGVVAAVDALFSALRARGHEVVCITPTMPGYRGDDRSVIRIPSLPLPAPTAYRLTLPLLPHAMFVRGGRPSIVHAHSAFVTGWLAARTARKYCVPHVFTYHTRLEDYVHYVPFEERVTRNAAQRLTRTYANGADAVIVPTPAMERHLRGLGVHARIVVVPSGIDVAFFGGGRRRADLRARFGAQDGAPLVLTVARLAREKNLDLLLAAFAALADPRARLVIAGDGPERERLESVAARCGIADRTHFAGELPRAELPDAYASADAFLFTSTSETQGLVLVEALAAGLPVVAVDTPQTRDVLADAAVLSAPDPQALARGLEAVTARGRADPASASRYDARQVAGRVVDLYAELLGATARAG